ncbi:MAG: sodium-dependent transporter [Gammaproteobacteria bacterium]|nr:sodium-dependent transporter [Gammaproteobacteria bacterium]
MSGNAHSGQHEFWSSRVGFIMAAVGAAVGLGNIWRFPYAAGTSGGSAFVLIYILAVIAVAMPMLVAELSLGRRGGGSPPLTFTNLAREAGASGNWRVLGFIGLFVVFMILTFYSVIGGWVMAYIPRSLSGEFADASGEQAAAIFAGLLENPLELIAWHAAFMVATVWIVARGVKRGIEMAADVLMPALFVLLVLMMFYAAAVGDFSGAVEFLFTPDFSKITPQVVMAAVGQALFSTAVGAGTMITYGAYLSKGESIPRMSGIIAGGDTLVALVAGLVVFPLVFANFQSPGEGPGLIFVTLPVAFGQMPGGAIVAPLFFVLLVFAALTSSIAMLEPIVSWAEEHAGARRPVAAIVAGLAAWLVGLATVFSFNIWQDVRPLGFIEMFKDKTPFDLIDFGVSNVMLPIAGLLILVFAGWVMPSKAMEEEITSGPSVFYTGWRFMARYVAPVAVVIVLINGFR